MGCPGAHRGAALGQIGTGDREVTHLDGLPTLRGRDLGAFRRLREPVPLANGRLHRHADAAQRPAVRALGRIAADGGAEPGV
jgi:hypothetical protein